MHVFTSMRRCRRRKPETGRARSKFRKRTVPLLTCHGIFASLCLCVRNFLKQRISPQKKVTKKSSHFKRKKNFLLEAKRGNKKAEDEALWWWKWRSGNKYHDWPGGHEPATRELERFEDERDGGSRYLSDRMMMIRSRLHRTAFKVDVIWKCSQ